MNKKGKNHQQIEKKNEYIYEYPVSLQFSATKLWKRRWVKIFRWLGFDMAFFFCSSLNVRMHFVTNWHFECFVVQSRALNIDYHVKCNRKLNILVRNSVYTYWFIDFCSIYCTWCETNGLLKNLWKIHLLQKSFGLTWKCHGKFFSPSQ